MAGSGGGGFVTKSRSDFSLDGPGGERTLPSQPQEHVLVRLVLSRVSAAVVKGADETEVSVGLAAFDVHDSYTSAALGKPCHLLTSGEATHPAAGRPIAARHAGDSGAGTGGVFHVTYLARDPSSSQYDGIDSEITAVLGPLSMAVRRPTIAALAAFPAALKAAKGENPRQNVASGTTAASSNDDSSAGGGGGGGGGAGGVGGYGGYGGITAVETGKNRVAMSVSARVESLRLALLLDDAEDDGMTAARSGCLVEAKVTSMNAGLKLYPSTLKVHASMGSLPVSYTHLTLPTILLV